MADVTEDVKVVTVSRDALRADLSDLELRLHNWMMAELDKKANDNDLLVLRMEIRQTAADLTVAREGAAKALSDALGEERKTGEARFSKLENAQARLIGGLILSGFLAPVLTGLIVFAITRISKSG